MDDRQEKFDKIVGKTISKVVVDSLDHIVIYCTDGSRLAIAGDMTNGDIVLAPTELTPVKGVS
jgi:hypothetical protein